MHKRRTGLVQHKVGVVIGLIALALLLASAAGAQQEGTVRFQETTGMLEGRIHMVEPESRLLVVERNSIPYNFNVTSDTRILIGYQSATTEQLAARKGAPVTVEYRATRKGNIAEEINVR